MATSLFFEFPEASLDAFSRARSLDEWYEAVQASGADDAPQFNGEESAASWQFSLAECQLPTAAGQLFVGDLRSGLEGASDPVVVFHGPASVSAIAGDLRERGESFFRNVLAVHGHEPDAWLY